MCDRESVPGRHLTLTQPQVHTHTGELATNTEPISTIRSYVPGSDVNVTYTGTLVKLGPASIDTLFQSEEALHKATDPK